MCLVLLNQEEFCHNCNEITNWTLVKDKFQRCTGCGDRFPCKKKCEHLDCMQVKGIKVLDEDAD